MTLQEETRLRKSARLMRILGWLLVVGLVPMVFIYPPGFMWGAVLWFWHPERKKYFSVAKRIDGSG